jgi:hypothetical protein
VPPEADWLGDLLQLLEELSPSVGTRASLTATWGLFRDQRPSGRQGGIVLLSRTGGFPADPGIPGLRRYTFQVMVISPKDDPLSGQQKAEQIYNHLAGGVAFTASTGRVFDFFQAEQHPALLGVDENGNVLYSSNYLTQVKEDTL